MRVVDMHCDTIAVLYADHRAGGTVSVLENNLMLDLKKMQAGDYGLQNLRFLPIWRPSMSRPLNTA